MRDKKGKKGHREGRRERRRKKKGQSLHKEYVSEEMREVETKLESPLVFLYIWAFGEVGVKIIFVSDWGESWERTKWIENCLDKYIPEINYSGRSGDVKA